MGGSLVDLASRRRLAGMLLIGGAAALLVAVCLAAGLLGTAQAGLSDLLFPSEGGDPGTVVVGIDDRSVRERGQWPWPRVLQAELVGALDAAGARAIVLDVVYDLPREGDDALAAAIRRAGRVVVAISVSPRLRPGRLPEAGEAVVAPVPTIGDAAAGFGFVDVPVDSADGVVRSAALAASHERGRVVPSLAYAAFSIVEGQDPGVLTVRPKGFQVADRLIPADRRKLMRIDFSERLASVRSPGHVSAADVLKGRATAGLKGKVVFVGITDPLGGDRKKTPLDKGDGSPGVLIHANAYSTMRARTFISTSPWWETVVWAALLAALAAGAGLGRRLWPAPIAATAVVGAYVILAAFRFEATGRQMNLLWPPASGAVSVVGTVGLRVVAERRRRREVERTLESVTRSSVPDIEEVERLAQFAELKDDDTGMHIHRVGAYAWRLARAAGLDEERAEAIRHASKLHDSGKIGVADAVLRKPGKLTDEEFDLMRRHPVDGHRPLANSVNELIRLAADIALNHHERWDGTGYPNRRRGDEIPLEARIVAIADVFDALTSKRPYKDPWPPEKALEEIVRCAGTHFDPDLVERFHEGFEEILELRSELAG